MERMERRFASGGEECAAWLFVPDGLSEPAPCVVLGSGFSCVRDQRLDAFGERFAAAGFVSLAFDYRYFGESGGEPRALVSAARQRQDWRAAIAFARALEEVDARRVALWGFSLGGGHVQALARADRELAAAICVCPLVDGVRTLLHIGGSAHLARLFVAGARDGLRALRQAEPYRVPAAGPPGSGAVLARLSALGEFEAVSPPGSTWRNEACARAALAPPYLLLERKARRIRCPVLFCISDQDEINPPELGVAASRNAPAGELRRYPGGHFAPLHGPAFEPVVADQLDFLDRRLRG